MKNNKGKKLIYFHTIGCRTNQAETAVLKNLFEMRGFIITHKYSPADVAVINTCTVTENSDSDCRKLVNRLVRENPNIEIALVGCQAQLQKEQLSQWPNVKWVIGNAEKMHAVSMIETSTDKKRAQVNVKSLPKTAFTIPAAGIDKQRTRANLKIQDGCNSFCNYCVVPYARGPARSRFFDDILKEAGLLAQAGYQEIVLTGINIGQYRYRAHGIADVIKSLIKIPGLARIRISSIEPTAIPQEILEIMETSPKLCRHLHIPIQSGDNEILNLMNRRYTIQEFLEFITLAKKIVPGILIGSDVIVGFPGETDEHFNRTYQFLEQAPINYLHVFSYSKRNLTAGNPASKATPVKVIQARSKLLRELSLAKRHAFYQKLLGSQQNVLFETKKDGFWRGFSDQYIPVITKSEKNLSNQFKRVTLKEICNDSIKSEL